MKPIIGTAPDGTEHLFPSKNKALEFVDLRRPGGTDSKKIEETMEHKGWKFRYLNENETIYYEEVLRKPRRKKYGADPRPESSTTDSRE